MTATARETPRSESLLGLPIRIPISPTRRHPGALSIRLGTSRFAQIQAGLEARTRLIRDGAELRARPFFEVQTYTPPGWAVFDEAHAATFAAAVEAQRRRVEAELVRTMMLPNALLETLCLPVLSGRPEDDTDAD